MKIPKLKNSTEINDAKRYVRALTRWIGLGFHPDNDMTEYVSCSAGARCFDIDVAETLNHELSLARKRLELASVDICSIALPVQRQLLLKAMFH